MEKDKGGELTPLQKGYLRLFNRQARALQLPCPYCKESLSRQDICMLVCQSCGHFFKVDILLLCLAADKCCKNCYGTLEIKDKNNLYCPACSLEYTVDELIKDA